MKLYIVVAALLLLVGCTNYEAQWAELEQQSWSRVQGVAVQLDACSPRFAIYHARSDRARPDTSSLDARTALDLQEGINAIEASSMFEMIDFQNRHPDGLQCPVDVWIEDITTFDRTVGNYVDTVNSHRATEQQVAAQLRQNAEDEQARAISDKIDQLQEQQRATQRELEDIRNQYGP